MSDEEKKYWVAVSLCPGVGPLRFLSLHSKLQKHKLSFKDLWQLDDNELSVFIPWPSIATSFIEYRQKNHPDHCWTEIQKQQVKILTYQEDEYPQLLQQIPDKPPILYVKGSLDHINHQPYAIVGTRNITQYGTFVTKKIVKELVEQECSIISGFMYGVDAVAHQTAIDHKGYTVGVLGFGFHHMYPPSHQKLAEKILKNNGALITEYYLTQAPHPGNFPARNRIVAGLCLGVVVTEAAQKSGSKITAQYALEYGRDVFAVPGAITSQYSDGTKDLINDGAKLVTSAADILQESQPHSSPNLLTDLLLKCTTEDDKKIVTLIAAQPLDIDELSEALQLAVSTLSSKLSLLELEGIIIQEQGKYALNF